MTKSTPAPSTGPAVKERNQSGFNALENAPGELASRGEGGGFERRLACIEQTYGGSMLHHKAHVRSDRYLRLLQDRRGKTGSALATVDWAGRARRGPLLLRVVRDAA